MVSRAAEIHQKMAQPASDAQGRLCFQAFGWPAKVHLISCKSGTAGMTNTSEPAGQELVLWVRFISNLK